MDKNKHILRVNDLFVEFKTEEGIIHAVNGMKLKLKKNETLAIVGESGSGKSVTSLAILKILDENGSITRGEVIYNNIDLTKLSQTEMNKIRGREISMIFQEPMSALNPVFTIGQQIMEAIKLHLGIDGNKAQSMAIELLHKVGIPEPEKRISQYPHELSGGMRQRAMIAMALSCHPAILIADEPTTALDVTIQAQILELMKQLQDEFGMSIIFITHDLGVVAEIADNVIVMYGGEVMESGSSIDIFKDSKHPYTWGLLNSIPRIDIEKDELWSIPGNVPNPLNFPAGCKFSSRCFLKSEKCEKQIPELFETGKKHFSRCWNIEQLIKKYQSGIRK